MKYYVYEHFDPLTQRCLYIGMGSGSRAYATKTTKAKQAAYGHRSPEHSDHLDELLALGYLPHEWVKFHYRGLDKPSALLFEKELISKLKPKYNRKQGIIQLKFSKEDIGVMEEMRHMGFSYLSISQEFDCGVMTIHRILNGKSPRYKEILEN